MKFNGGQPRGRGKFAQGVALFPHSHGGNQPPPPPLSPFMIPGPKFPLNIRAEKFCALQTLDSPAVFGFTCWNIYHALDRGRADPPRVLIAITLDPLDITLQ